MDASRPMALQALQVAQAGHFEFVEYHEYLAMTTFPFVYCRFYASHCFTFLAERPSCADISFWSVTSYIFLFILIPSFIIHHSYSSHFGWLLRSYSSHLGCFIELDDGKNYRKPLYLVVKTMVSHWDFPVKTNPLLHPSSLCFWGAEAESQAWKAACASQESCAIDLGILCCNICRRAREKLLKGLRAKSEAFHRSIFGTWVAELNAEKAVWRPKISLNWPSRLAIPGSVQVCCSQICSYSCSLNKFNDCLLCHSSVAVQINLLACHKLKK